MLSPPPPSSFTSKNCQIANLERPQLMVMLGLEPQASGVVSHCSANYATTMTHLRLFKYCPGLEGGGSGIFFRISLSKQCLRPFGYCAPPSHSKLRPGAFLCFQLGSGATRYDLKSPSCDIASCRVGRGRRHICPTSPSLAHSISGSSSSHSTSRRSTSDVTSVIFFFSAVVQSFPGSPVASSDPPSVRLFVCFFCRF